MYRGKLGDILKVMEGQQTEQRHPLLDQIEYLSEAEKDEVLLINYRFGEIAGVLNSAPPKVRFDLYRHLCSQFHARRDLMSGDEVKHYINAAVSEARRVMPPPSQPAIEQTEAKASAHLQHHQHQPLHPVLPSGLTILFAKLRSFGGIKAAGKVGWHGTLPNEKRMKVIELLC